LTLTCNPNTGRLCLAEKIVRYGDDVISPRFDLSSQGR
jgi:predicted hotdog family 3-hydroxylacyl-ACP dehydratase